MFHCYARGTGYYVYASFTTVSYQVSFTTVMTVRWNRKSFFRRVPCKQCWKINSVSFLSVDRPLYSFPSAFSQSCRLLCRSYHISEEPLKALLFRDACIISDNSVRSDKIKEKISDKSRSAVLLIQHHKDIVFQPVR